MRLTIALLTTLALALACAAPAAAGWWPSAAIDFAREPYRIHLRKGPGTSTESLGEFYSGAEVTVLDRSNPEWYQIDMGRYGTGYMQAKYLRMIEYEDGSGAAKPYAVHDARPWAVVQSPNPADRLHLRERPSSDWTSRGKYYNGTKVRIDGEVGAWSYVLVEDEDGPKAGFMLSKYLTRIGGPGRSTSIGRAQGKAVVVNPNPADRLHLRKEPDRGAPSLGKYYTGVVVDVLPYDAGAWALVRIGETVGYMLREYLKTDGVDRITPAIPAAQITGGGSEGVILRESATNSSPEVGVIPPAETVEVLGLAEDWTHVRHDGRIGYVQARDLKQ